MEPQDGADPAPIPPMELPDNGSTTGRSMRSAPTGSRRDAAETAGRRGLAASAAHTARMARARTRSQTREGTESTPPVPCATVRAARTIEESTREGLPPEGPLPLVGQVATPPLETTPASRDELRNFLREEMRQLVPEFVGAELSETVRRIVEERATTHLDRTVDRFLGDPTFWDLLIGAVEGVVRTTAQSRANLPPPISPNHQPVPDEPKLTHGDHASAQAAPMAPILRYTRLGHGPLGGGKDTGHGTVDRGTGDIFVLPDRYGHATRMKKKVSSKKKKSSRKAREDSDTDTSVLTDGTDGDTDSSDEDAEADVSHLRKIRPLNDLFRRVMDFRKYRLKNRSGRYDPKIAKTVTKVGKLMSLQMKGASFSGDDPITVLRFLSRFRGACDQNGLHEGAALWCFQFFLTGSALARVQSRLLGESGAVDGHRDEVLSSYPEVVNYLLRTYATDEIIAEAYSEVTNYIQSTGMSEMEYGDRLWRKALRCGNVFSDDRLKSLYAEGLLPAIRVQVRHHLTTHPRLSFMELTRYAEGCGTAHRGGKKYLPLPKGRDKLPPREAKSSRGLFFVDSSSESGVGSLAEEAEAGHLAMAVEGSTVPSPPATRSTGFTSTQGTPSPRVWRPPSEVGQDFNGPARAKLWGQTAPQPPRPHGNPPGNAETGAKTPGGCPPCRLCLSRERPCCPRLTPQLRAQILGDREKAYQDRRNEGYYSPAGSRSPRNRGGPGAGNGTYPARAGTPQNPPRVLYAAEPDEQEGHPVPLAVAENEEEVE